MESAVYFWKSEWPPIFICTPKIKFPVAADFQCNLESGPLYERCVPFVFQIRCFKRMTAVIISARLKFILAAGDPLFITFGNRCGRGRPYYVQIWNPIWTMATSVYSILNVDMEHRDQISFKNGRLQGRWRPLVIHTRRTTILFGAQWERWRWLLGVVCFQNDCSATTTMVYYDIKEVRWYYHAMRMHGMWNIH